MNTEEIKQKIFEAMVGEKRDRGELEVFVTDLVYDCLRIAYYSNIYGKYYTMKDIVTTFVGKAVHEPPIFEENELSLEWKGIKGRIDDYDPKNKILLEKKTCRRIPDRPHEHHIRQVEYYKVMMEENGYEVKQCFICYIDVANSKIEVFEVKPRDSETIKNEIIAKKDRLIKALLELKPPERKVGWLCNYCPYFNLCMRKEVRKDEDSSSMSILQEKDEDDSSRNTLQEKEDLRLLWKELLSLRPEEEN